ncbi:hypothetical protein, partial [Bilophila wadsworthia]|uniref:hypothetical protein n=1 Tax=Bilophila wadsworthia TaxID=35833 RepID=UPI00307D6427
MMRKIHTVFHLTLYLLISFSFGTTRPPMPLGGKYFPTRLKVMHHFRTQHLKPSFGKSMRLAGKEEKGREGKTNANYGANRAGKAVGKK